MLVDDGGGWSREVGPAFARVQHRRRADGRGSLIVLLRGWAAGGGGFGLRVDGVGFVGELRRYHDAMAISTANPTDEVIANCISWRYSYYRDYPCWISWFEATVRIDRQIA